MNDWSVTWTTLPDGFAENGRTRFSIMPSLQVTTSTGRLHDSPVADWPALLTTLPDLVLEVAGMAERITLTRVGPRPRSALWKALFGPNTPVALPEPQPPIFMPITTSVSYGPLVAALDRIYEQALVESPTRRLRAEHPVAAAVAALAGWDLGTGIGARSLADGSRAQVAELLDPAALTSARVDEAARVLREHGQEAAARTVALVPVLARLRAAAVTSAEPGVATPAHPSLLSGVRALDQADFHQVVGLVGDHAALARELGLRIDVEAPPLNGTLVVRVLGADGQWPFAEHAAPSLWSRIVADPAKRRVTMATRPGGQVRTGTVDLAAASETYVATTRDVLAQTTALAAMAGALAGSNPPPHAALPPRRTTGIVLAQVDRKDRVLTPSLVRNTQLGTLGSTGADQARTGPAGVTPVPNEMEILDADDVTQGYRVDVSTDGGGFRSLMRRDVRYRLPSGSKDAPFEITASDEGMVDAMSAVEQRDDHNVPHLFVGEELFGWHNWSLAVPMPGRRATGDAAPAPAVAEVTEEIAPGYPLSLRAVATPGSLPRLRFGRRYRFRVRAVDLAGNTIDPQRCDPAQISAEVPYLRLDAVPPPVLVPRAPFTAGESLTRLVVRSDGDGGPLGGPCERHLAAPKSSHHLAEMHGEFDTAFGPDSPTRAAARERMLAIGRAEEGAFTDMVVPDPEDPTRTMAAPGVRVAVNADAAHGPTTTLPLPRGAALPAGEYVVADTEAAALPYLPDPAAAGIAVRDVADPDAKQMAIIDYPRRAWPDARPVRMVATGGPVPGVRLVPGKGGGRPMLAVTVAPATETRLELSSTLHPDVLPAFDGAALVPAAAAVAGQVPLLTPSEPITIVHVVRRPLVAPVVPQATCVPRKLGATTAALSGSVTCHTASTGRVDVEAIWHEPVDDGSSPIRDDPRSTTGEPLTVTAGSGTLAWAATLSFGDPRRRDVTIRGIGATRFREYFPTLPPGDPSMQRVGEGTPVVVPNAGRPPRLRVHSIIPTFRWTRATAGRTTSSVRRVAGLRVYLHRPWLRSGTGELLGVVVFANEAAGTSSLTAKRPLSRLVSRWASDPLGGPDFPSPPLTAAAFPAGTRVATLPLVEAGATSGADAGAASVVGHEVHYDAGRDLWYADIDVAIPAMEFPFVRLGLVRYQPESIAGCHVSPVEVADLAQLAPSRGYTVELLPDDSGLRVTRGPGFTHLKNVEDRVVLLRRSTDGSRGGALVVGSDATQSPASISQASPANPHPDAVIRFGPGEAAASAAALAQCDLVVLAVQKGTSLSSDGSTERIVFIETFEGARLAALAT